MVINNAKFDVCASCSLEEIKAYQQTELCFITIRKIQQYIVTFKLVTSYLLEYHCILIAETISNFTQYALRVLSASASDSIPNLDETGLMEKIKLQCK